ncbi:MAG: electron transfer flavoprotein subunit beta/FixA family protein [Candidatus Marinimicrobia bacterium]|nr:electron transfer flavoprotein subunit beta/FixA family protein [Candidatus Neomarinimicrobiota bacterium]
MSYRVVVLVKQVPDTANITGNVMKEDGTINRSKLPAIFNPEDKVALEIALRVKEKYGGSVTVISMGPPRAADILRESLYMGADKVYLISDVKFAGADTLATSYVLSEAIKYLGEFDLIMAGRQAIDGDTAQVGPQTAEKLGIPQITYTEEILELDKDHIIVKKRIDGGYEIVESRLPVLLTIVKDAAEPRPFSAKRVMYYKKAKTIFELSEIIDDTQVPYLDNLIKEYDDKGLLIKTITAKELQLPEERCGLRGSPTKVYKIDSVVLASKEPVVIEPTKEGLGRLIDELMADRIFG